MSKKCAKPGDKQKLTVKTKPEVAVTYVSQYSDGDSYNENGGGVSDKEGNFEDEFIVDLKAPDGTVTITVTAGTRQTGPSFDQVKYTVNC